MSRSSGTIIAARPRECFDEKAGLLSRMNGAKRLRMVSVTSPDFSRPLSALSACFTTGASGLPRRPPMALRADFAKLRMAGAPMRW